MTIMIIFSIIDDNDGNDFDEDDNKNNYMYN